MTEHTTTVVNGGRGVTIARCSCGWERRYGGPSRIAVTAAASHESDARRGHL